jgi:hypothetical protein
MKHTNTCPPGFVLRVSARLFAGLVVIASASGTAFAAENLIAKRAYTYFPEPSYADCKDGGDKVQLTDGQTHYAGNMWVNKSCVGWASGVDVPIVIHFDLGKEATLNELRFNTCGGGGAGVVEVGLRVFLSLDDKSYVAAATHAAPAPKKGANQRFGVQIKVPLDGARARYVAVAAMAPAPHYFVFVDEIELYGTIPADPKSILPIQPGIPGSGAKELQGLLSGGRRSFLFAGNLVAPIERQIASWPKPLASQARKDRDQFLARAIKTADPGKFEKLRLAFTERYRTLARAAYQSEMLVWEALPDEKFVMLSLPEALRPKQQASVHTVINALEATALGVANLTDKPHPLRVSVAGGGEGAPEVGIRVARFFKTMGAQYVPDALLAADCPQTIPSGESRLIWIGVESTDATPGRYRYQADVRLGHVVREIPLEVVVHDVTLSKKPQLDAFNWAYLNGGNNGDPVYAKVREQMLKYRITDGACTSVAFPRKNDAGDVVRPVEMDFKKMDQYLDFNKDFKLVSFFYPFNQSYDHPSLDWFGKAAWMSPEYKAVFREWLLKFVARIKQSGRDYDGFYLQFFDETLDGKVAELCRLVKEIDPRVQVMATIPQASRSAVQEFVKSGIDIFVYHGTHLKYDKNAAPYGWTDGLELLSSGGRKLWLYHAADSHFGSGRERDPLSVYRLMHWLAFRHGADGVGFWDMLHNNTRSGLNPWEDPLFYPMVDTISARSPAPADVKTAEIVIPTRRWEHTRMGIEDYMLLRLARERIAALPQAERDEYSKKLDQLVKDVLSNLPDANPSRKSRSEFRGKRRELMEMVGALSENE